MRRAAVIVIFLLLATSIAHTLPPGGAARGLREGANHRLGDDSFVARFGRMPGRPSRWQRACLPARVEHA